MGFTLVELLVAMALLAILSISLVLTLNHSASLGHHAESQIRSRRDARAVLESIGNEIKSATLAHDRSSVADLQFLVNPGQIDAKYLNPHALFWQSPIATDARYGDLAEVGYFVRWNTENPNNPRGILCRLFVNPEDPASPTNYLIYSQPSAWLSPGGNKIWLDQTAPAVADSANPVNSYKGWIADNVIALWARCLDGSGNAITKDGAGGNAGYVFDSRKGYAATNMFRSGYTNESSVFVPLASLPCAVEIAIVTLDETTANRLASIPTPMASNPVNFWAEIDIFVNGLPAAVRTGARVYSTRIILPNHN